VYDVSYRSGFWRKKNKNKEKRERKKKIIMINKEKKEKVHFALFLVRRRKVRTTNKRTASKTCILKIIDFVYPNSVAQVVAIDLNDLVL